MFVRVVVNIVSVIPKHSKPKVTTSRPLKEGTEAGGRGHGLAPPPLCVVQFTITSLPLYSLCPFWDVVPIVPMCGPVPGHVSVATCFLDV